MPIVRFVCPHCDKPAEVQVSGVTRSRPCPHCGGSVVLQVAFVAKDTGYSKRPALLVNSVSDAPVAESTVAPKLGSLVPVAVKRSQSEPPADPEPPSAEAADTVPDDAAVPVRRQLPVMRGPAYEPKELDGSVLERMRLDPEVRQLKLRLALGAAAFAAALAFVFAGFNVEDPKPQDLTRQDAAEMLGGSEVVKRLKSKNAVVLMRAAGDKTSSDAPTDAALELHNGDSVTPRKTAEEASAVIEQEVASKLTGS